MFLSMHLIMIENCWILNFINQLNECYSGCKPWDLLGLLGLARMVNWLSKAAPFVLDPNLAKPITRLSASWHEKLGLWLFPSMAVEEIEFWFEEYWGSILLRRADSSEDLGVVGAVESLTLSRVAAQVIVLFHDQMIRKSDDFTI